MVREQSTSAWAGTFFSTWQRCNRIELKPWSWSARPLYFPEQARAIMRQVAVENQPPGEWEVMRKRHKLGDEQIVALREWQRGMKDSYDDMFSLRRRWPESQRQP